MSIQIKIAKSAFIAMLAPPPASATPHILLAPEPLVEQLSVSVLRHQNSVAFGSLSVANAVEDGDYYVWTLVGGGGGFPPTHTTMPRM